MKQGWIAMWNPFLGQKVHWQEAKPRWRRMVVPKQAAVVLECRAAGRDARDRPSVPIVRNLGDPA
jgi:hypothetical protein